MRKELDFQDIQTKELAEKTGICKRTLDGYLAKSGNEPTVGNACKIAQALGVSVEWLAEGGCAKNELPFSDIVNSLQVFSKDDIAAVRSVVSAIRGKYY